MADVPLPPPAGNRRRKIAVFWLRQGLAAAGLALFVASLVQLLGSAPDDFTGWFRSGPRPGGSVAVILDPGHGGADSGAVAQGMVEKDLNLDVARRVAQALRLRGVVVRMTREDDRFVSLAGRVTMGNAAAGAIFVSIHFNDSPASAAATGIETYYSQTRETGPASRWMWASLLGGAPGRPGEAAPADCVRESERLAHCIQGALVAGTAAADRGIKERALYVTRRVLAPAVLVEGGFVSHPAEARRLGDPEYRRHLAKFIADGILNYLATPTRRASDPAVAGL